MARYPRYLSTATLAGAPVAQRSSRPGWRDPRLWVGVALVAGSVVAGARIVGAADDTVAVWAAEVDLGAGTSLAEVDLVRRHVRFADGDGLAAYLRADRPLPEGQLLRAVGSGELLPRAAVGSAARSGTVQLPVSVEPEQVPPSVDAGAVVDVYVVAPGGSAGAGAGARTGEVEPALAGASVVAAPAIEESFGTTGRRQLVLAVPEADAQHFFALLGAAEQATVTVVRRG
ncbi:MAG TPA: hypothetical protein VGE38_08790 [Nocardioides sp.]|uniref:hypothetical protein n=1 Tax=Nocardioides sp. TaxID=35761 RepID=UPI002EDB8C6C